MLECCVVFRNRVQFDFEESLPDTSFALVREEAAPVTGVVDDKFWRPTQEDGHVIDMDEFGFSCGF